MSKRVLDDLFSVIEDSRVAAVLNRLYSEANRQQFRVFRNFLPHALSFLRTRYMPFAETEMNGA